jgi:rSAM/selenodomain-associated transferase 1
MSPGNPDVTVAVLAKAPVPGFAKTRLIPALGAHGAAVLQERLTERMVTAACAAALGPVALWCAPDCTHVSFRDLADRYPLQLAPQPEADLGARILAAIAGAGGPVLVIGTDCPVLTADHLRAAAAALRDHETVVVPAEDGGYVLIGMRRPHDVLFSDMSWSTETVMDETRRRIMRAGLSCRELPTLWDIDRPDDVGRMEREGFDLLG